jgi:hypothetical protein
MNVRYQSSALPDRRRFGPAVANVVAALTQVVQQGIAPFLRVVEETFSGMGVTPRGQRVEFQTEDWLRFAQVSQPAGAVAPLPGTPPALPSESELQ